MIVRDDGRDGSKPMLPGPSWPNASARCMSNLTRRFQAAFRMHAPVLADILIDPLFTHDEIVTGRQNGRNTFGHLRHTPQEVEGEPDDGDVIHEEACLIGAQTIARNRHD